MKIEIVKVGYLETNCYILSKENKVLVIDTEDIYIFDPNNIKIKKIYVE